MNNTARKLMGIGLGIAMTANILAAPMTAVAGTGTDTQEVVTEQSAAYTTLYNQYTDANTATDAEIYALAESSGHSLTFEGSKDYRDVTVTYAGTGSLYVSTKKKIGLIYDNVRTQIFKNLEYAGTYGNQHYGVAWGSDSALNYCLSHYNDEDKESQSDLDKANFVKSLFEQYEAGLTTQVTSAKISQANLGLYSAIVDRTIEQYEAKDLIDTFNVDDQDVLEAYNDWLEEALEEYTNSVKDYCKNVTTGTAVTVYGGWDKAIVQGEALKADDLYTKLDVEVAGKLVEAIALAEQYKHAEEVTAFEKEVNEFNINFPIIEDMTDDEIDEALTKAKGYQANALFTEINKDLQNDINNIVNDLTAEKEQRKKTSEATQKGEEWLKYAANCLEMNAPQLALENYEQIGLWGYRDNMTDTVKNSVDAMHDKLQQLLGADILAWTEKVEEWTNIEQQDFPGFSKDPRNLAKVLEAEEEATHFNDSTIKLCTEDLQNRYATACDNLEILKARLQDRQGDWNQYNADVEAFIKTYLNGDTPNLSTSAEDIRTNNHWVDAGRSAYTAIQVTSWYYCYLDDDTKAQIENAKTRIEEQATANDAYHSAMNDENAMTAFISHFNSVAIEDNTTCDLTYYVDGYAETGYADLADADLKAQFKEMYANVKAYYEERLEAETAYAEWVAEDLGYDMGYLEEGKALLNTKLHNDTKQELADKMLAIRQGYQEIDEVVNLDLKLAKDDPLQLLKDAKNCHEEVSGTFEETKHTHSGKGVMTPWCVTNSYEINYPGDLDDVILVTANAEEDEWNTGEYLDAEYAEHLDNAMWEYMNATDEAIQEWKNTDTTDMTSEEVQSLIDQGKAWLGESDDLSATQIEAIEDANAKFAEILRQKQEEESGVKDWKDAVNALIEATNDYTCDTDLTEMQNNLLKAYELLDKVKELQVFDTDENSALMKRQVELEDWINEQCENYAKGAKNWVSTYRGLIETDVPDMEALNEAYEAGFEWQDFAKYNNDLNGNFTNCNYYEFKEDFEEAEAFETILANGLNEIFTTLTNGLSDALEHTANWNTATLDELTNNTAYSEPTDALALVELYNAGKQLSTDLINQVKDRANDIEKRIGQLKEERQQLKEFAYDVAEWLDVTNDYTGFNDNVLASAYNKGVMLTNDAKMAKLDDLIKQNVSERLNGMRAEMDKRSAEQEAYQNYRDDVLEALEESENFTEFDDEYLEYAINYGKQLQDDKWFNFLEEELQTAVNDRVNAMLDEVAKRTQEEEINTYTEVVNDWLGRTTDVTNFTNDDINDAIAEGNELLNHRLADVTELGTTIADRIYDLNEELNNRQTEEEKQRELEVLEQGIVDFLEETTDVEGMTDEQLAEAVQNIIDFKADRRYNDVNAELANELEKRFEAIADELDKRNQPVEVEEDGNFAGDNYHPVEIAPGVWNFIPAADAMIDNFETETNVYGGQWK